MSAIISKLFPITLGVIAGVLLHYLSLYKYGSVLSSLCHLAFSITYFLVFFTVFSELNKHSDKIADLFKKLINKIKDKIKIKKETQNVPPEPALNSVPADTSVDKSDSEGLITIKKKSTLQVRQESTSIEKRVLEILYTAGFLALAFWRINAALKAIPLSYTVRYGSSIVVAVLALIVPCVAFLYLKIKKESGIYGDLLKLFSYVSFIYAAIIAATSVLNINFMVVLQWIFYAASAYLISGLAVNILLSFLKGDILNFEYTLFPKISRKAWEAQAAKWKVSIKSLYTIRYTLKILPALVLALVFVLFVSTSVFVVQPHQQAAVYHLGKLQPTSIKNEGLHFKFPWPVDRAVIYDVHRASSMQIGYEASGRANFLWGLSHDGGEYMLLLGNGNEMAAVNLKIMYVISDLYSYIKTSADPQSVLSAAAYNALMSRTINTTLDSFLSVDRSSLAQSVLEELSDFCEAENLGLSITQIIIESIHPPVEIADVYQKVVSASVEKTTAITRAQIYAETKVAEAHRQSQTGIDQARAVQFSRVSDAQREMAVFSGAMEAYRIAGGSFDLTKQMEVYEKIISSNKVYVFSQGAQRDISKFIIGKNTVNVLELVKGEEQ
jgi:membrane protease subunit HflK